MKIPFALHKKFEKLIFQQFSATFLHEKTIAIKVFCIKIVNSCSLRFQVGLVGRKNQP